MLPDTLELCFHAGGKGADMMDGDIPHVAFAGAVVSQSCTEY